MKVDAGNRPHADIGWRAIVEKLRRSPRLTQVGYRWRGNLVRLGQRFQDCCEVGRFTGEGGRIRAQHVRGCGAQRLQ
jgi:hypothetical protein